MSVSLKTVSFGFRPNLYIYIVIYLCNIYTFTSIITIVLLLLLLLLYILYTKNNISNMIIEFTHKEC